MTLWWLKGILWKQVWVYINNPPLWKCWGHRFTLRMHATFAVSLTAMTLYRGAEVYWMHQKVQYYTFSPTTTSLTCILQFLTYFLFSQKCSSVLVKLPLKIKQYSQNGLSDFHPLHNKKNLFVVQGWSANCFSSATRWSLGLGLTWIPNYYRIPLFLLSINGVRVYF